MTFCWRRLGQIPFESFNYDEFIPFPETPDPNSSDFFPSVTRFIQSVSVQDLQSGSLAWFRGGGVKTGTGVISCSHSRFVWEGVMGIANGGGGETGVGSQPQTLADG